jgi:hypothetical protein
MHLYTEKHKQHDFQVDEGNTIPEKLVIRRLFLPCLSISEDAIMVPM